jgi:carboxylesterase
MPAMAAPPILPGAEPFSAPGGPHGALVLHGFTGTPQSMRGLAEAFAAAGFATELPLLPGHGTTPEDMATTGWSDWTAAAEAAYQDLAGRCDKVVVAGLSMGGALAVWLAERHPEIAGLVTINALVQSPDPNMGAVLEQLLADGVELAPGIASDIAAEGVEELAYPLAPVRSMQTLLDAADDLGARLGDIRCPTLVLVSPQDHVVPPASSDRLAAEVSGPVELVRLERSYHVATLDDDRDEIFKRAVELAQQVTGS